jgi:hypothetical protein
MPLLGEARKKHVPTFYTTAEENRANSTVLVGGWAAKSNRTTGAVVDLDFAR